MRKNIKISENVTFESIEDNIYILNISDGEYYKLSTSASNIWREIEKGIDLESLKIKFKSIFFDHPAIEHDIDELIKDLIDLNLITDN